MIESLLLVVWYVACSSVCRCLVYRSYYDYFMEEREKGNYYGERLSSKCLASIIATMYMYVYAWQGGWLEDYCK